MSIKRSATQRVLAVILSLLMVFVLLPATVFAAEAPTTSYIGFTSDVHGATANLTTWLDKLNDTRPTLNQFIFGGDFDYTESNCNVTAANCVSAVRTAFSGTPVYTARGNHDVSDAAEFSNKGTAAITNATSSNIGYNTGLVYNGSDYAVYIMDSSSQSFLDSDINTLSGVLDSIAEADASKPVLVISHIPIHYFSAARNSGNTLNLLNVLNPHSNVVFLWGHNHSQNDPQYGKLKVAGDTIQYMSSASMQIGFTYASMGSIYTDVNGARGLLATIVKQTNSSTVNLQYKDLTGVTVAPSPYSVSITSTNTIESVALDIDQPVGGATPDSSAVVTSGAATAGTVTWNSAAFTTGTLYTASVMLTAATGKTFTASPAVTVNGSTASVTRDSDTQLTVTYQFPGALAPSTTVTYNKVTSITSGKEYAIVMSSLALNTTSQTGSTSSLSYTGLGYTTPTISGDTLTFASLAEAAAATWTFTATGNAWHISNQGAYLYAPESRSLGVDSTNKTAWTFGTLDSNTQIYATLHDDNSSSDKTCKIFYGGSSTVPFFYPSVNNNGNFTLYEKSDSTPPDPSTVVTLFKEVTELTAGGKYIIVANDGTTNYAVKFQTVANTQYAVGSAAVSIIDGAGYSAGSVSLAGTDIILSASDILLWSYNSDNQFKSVANSTFYLYGGKVNPSTGAAGDYTVGLYAITTARDCIYTPANHKIYADGSSDYYFTIASGGTFSVTATAGNGSTIRIFKEIEATTDGGTTSQTITYNANTGTGAMAATSGNTGTAVTLSANTFTKAGFTFTGWNTAADGSGMAYTDGQTFNMPEGGLTLFAQWTASAATFELATSVESGSTYLIVAKSGSDYYALTTATANTDFLAGVPVTVSGNYVTSTADTTMLWNFTTATSGTYDVKNGSNFLLRVSGSGGKLKIATADSGASYSDWKYNSSTHNLTTYSTSGSADNYLYRTTSGTIYFLNSTESDNGGMMYLYKLNSSAANQTIAYNANGGIGAAMTNSTGTAGAAVSLTANTYTRAGYSFLGWSTDPNGTTATYTDGQSITMPISGLSLYAVWATLITYNANSGSGTMADTAGPAGASVTLSSNTFTKAGYTFNGWDTVQNGSGVAYSDGQTIIMPVGGLTLYAQWVLDTTIYELDTDGPDSGDTYLIVAKSGSTYYALTNVSSSSTVMTTGAVIVDGSFVTSGATNSMLWTFASYSGSDGAGYTIRDRDDNYLIRVSGGGLYKQSSIGSYYVTWSYIMSTINTLKNLHTSSGSQYSITFSGSTTNLSTTTSTGTAIYLYKLKTGATAQTVAYDANGGVGSMANTTGIAGSEVVLRANVFTKDGFTFNGWNTAANGTGMAYTNGQTISMPEGGLNLFAQWVTSSTLSAVSGSGEYGGTGTLTATLQSGGVPLASKTVTFFFNSQALDAITDVNGVATYSCMALHMAGINAGVHNGFIGVSFAGDAGYNASTGTGTLTVAPKPITVTADASGKAVGAVDPALTYACSESGVSFTGALSRAAGENVGSYAIAQGNLSAGTNYIITFVPASFTISAKDITVLAVANSKVYGTADPTLTYTCSESGVSFTGALSRAVGEAVNTYAINQGSLSAGNNYAITFVPADFSITAKAITVMADNQSKVVGSADPALTYHFTIGELESGDALSGALVRAPGEIVGTYAITQGSLAATSNYVLTVIPGTFTITTAPTPVFNSVSGSGVYSGTGTLTATLQHSGTPLSSKLITFTLDGTLIGTATTNASGVASINLTAEQLAAYDAGTYNAYVTADFAGDAGYSPNTATGALIVNPRTITVTADARSKVFGEIDPVLTYTCSESGVSFTGALSRAPGENAETYAISLNTLSAGTNNAITFVSADFTITAKAITVTADAVGKVYGAADPALTYQVTSGSLVSGESLSGGLSRAPGENAATYAISVGTLATANTNYAITFVSANFTISPIAITVTADAVGKVYGAADPALTYQVTSGSLVSGESLSGGLSREPGENAAIYAISVGTLATTNTNYAITFVPANFTITAKAITVTADAKSKVQGAADPALTYQVTSGSLKTGDTLSGALTRAPGETVGIYAITQGTLSAGTNYTITYVSANFTITSGGGIPGDPGPSNPPPSGGGGSGVLGATSKVFIDVKEGDWFYPAVQYVVDKGVFSGTSDTMFEPGTPMSRAMLVSVLYRLAGSPAVTAANPFTDVASGMWYTNAVIWAADKGIATGYPNHTFRPSINLTREQLVDILFQYAKYKGYDVTIGSGFNLSVFTDASKLTAYTKPAMKWACGAGLIHGRTPTTLAPLESASRAEVAQVLKKFIEDFVK